MTDVEKPDWSQDVTKPPNDGWRLPPDWPEPEGYVNLGTKYKRFKSFVRIWDQLKMRKRFIIPAYIIVSLFLAAAIAFGSIIGVNQLFKMANRFEAKNEPLQERKLVWDLPAIPNNQAYQEWVVVLNPMDDVNDSAANVSVTFTIDGKVSDADTIPITLARGERYDIDVSRIFSDVEEISVSVKITSDIPVAATQSVYRTTSRSILVSQQN